MVIALSPGKFYGSSPQIYTDIKYNTDHMEASIKKRQESSLSPKFKKIAKKAGISPTSPVVSPAPIAYKRKRWFMGFVDDGVADGGKKWPIRKLLDEFERVATKKGEMEMGIMYMRL
ncbi:hypothetical protein Tco_1385237 [Tanacetum coccineum]